jgi:hypothetical protein
MAVCFVITPFKSPFKEIYEQTLKPMIASAGFEARRGDDLSSHDSNLIMQDVWEGIVNAQICLADLTDDNPNVLYEVGLAMAINKPIIFITQKPDKLPFDLKPHRAIDYDPENPEPGLRDRLVTTLQKHAQNPIAESRPVWKVVKTPAEMLFDRLNQHGTERASAVDLQDRLMPAYADEFFVAGSQAENSILKQAQSELWLVYETGSTILRQEDISLISFLKNGGSLRLLLVSETIQHIVLYRHRFADVDADYLVNRYRETRLYLKSIARESGVALQSPQFQARWLPFPVSFVGVFADPYASTERDRYCALRFIGFRAHVERERALVMRSDLSPQTFAYYLNQVETMWNVASPDE